MSNKLPERTTLPGMEAAARELADLIFDGDRTAAGYELARLQALERFVAFGADHMERYAIAMEERAVLIERLAGSLEQCNEIIADQASHIERLRAHIDGQPKLLH